jgi:flagellin
MPISIASNINSLRAIKQLGNASESLGSTFERLSSGLRINKASDDAAGLAISENLKTDSRVFTQGIRNINDGISALNISQGALSSLSTILTRQAELAEQAANGVYSIRQRQALDNEAKALSQEYNRIISTARFNGNSMFDVSNPAFRIQAGYGIDGSILVNLGQQLDRAVGNGIVSSVQTWSGGATGNIDQSVYDFNNDGIRDYLLANAGWGSSIALGNNDGSFRLLNGPSAADSAADFNGDGILDIVGAYPGGTATWAISLGLGDGTFAAQTTFNPTHGVNDVVTGDVNGDGRMDVVVQSHDGVNQNRTLTYLGNGNGTFQGPRTSILTGGWAPGGAATVLADFNNDGVLDLISSTGSSSTMTVGLGNRDGTFSSGTVVNSFGILQVTFTLDDFNKDGNLDVIAKATSGSNAFVFMGNGNGSFGAAVTLTTTFSGGAITTGDINGDGFADVFVGNGTNSNVFFGNGNGSFNSALSTTLAGGAFQSNYGTAGALVDTNGDGVLDLVQGSASGINVYRFTQQNILSWKELNLLTASTARTALDEVRSQLSRVSQELGSIGAFQSRLEIASNVLLTSKENYLAANSRITDIDVAEETANLTKSRILQQVATSVLSQANLQPQLALQLLQ